MHLNFLQVLSRYGTSSYAAWLYIPWVFYANDSLVGRYLGTLRIHYDLTVQRVYRLQTWLVSVDDCGCLPCHVGKSTPCETLIKIEPCGIPYGCMTTMFSLNQSMTVTGLIIFLLGMLTVTPEIFFSGVIVMICSTSQGIRQLETMRAEESHVQTTGENQSYYAW